MRFITGHNGLYFLLKMFRVIGNSEKIVDTEFYKSVADHLICCQFVAEKYTYPWVFMNLREV